MACSIRMDRHLQAAHLIALVTLLLPKMGFADCFEYNMVTNPQFVGKVASLYRDLVVSGTYAFVVGTSAGNTAFQVIDISNPAVPIVVGSAGYPSVIQGEGVAVSGSYAYVADDTYDPNTGGSGVLRIFDVSNPASPTLVTSVSSTAGTSGLPGGIAASGNYVYAACPDGVSGHLQIIDVSRPSRASTVATVPVDLPCYSLALSGHYVYVAGAKQTVTGLGTITVTTGLRVIDISDPKSPVVVGALTLTAPQSNTASVWYQLAAAGNYVYAAGYPGLQVIDVSNPASPALVGTDLGFCRGVAVQGSTAYLVDGTQSGIRVVDVLNPISPTPIGRTYMTSTAVTATPFHLYVLGGITGFPVGLYIFPLQCSSSPCMVATEAMDVDPNTISLTGHGTAVTAQIELPAEYDPAQVLLNTVRLNGIVAPSSVSLEITDWNHNQIPDFQVEFPRDQVEVSLQEGEHVPVSVTGDIGDACSFTGTVTVRVIRPHLTHPNGSETYLTGTSTLVSWENPAGRTVSYAQLYYSPDGGDSWGLVADHLLGTSYAWAVPQEATQNGRLRVVVLDDLGVMGYDSSDGPFVIANATGVGDALPTMHRLYQNSPNPFADATRVAFDLPIDGRVTLQIFDLTGREIRRLSNDWYPAGRHDVSWDGRDAAGRLLAGGIYFLHMKAGLFSDTKRMYLQR